MSLLLKEPLFVNEEAYRNVLIYEIVANIKINHP